MIWYQLKVHPEGLNKCNANLIANYAEFKTNDANGQLKTRCEAGFPVKGSKTYSLYSSRLGVEVLNCLLIEIVKPTNMLNMMQAMNSKYKRSNNISASNSNRVRAKEKTITNTRDLFRDSSTKLYVSAFTAWKISLFTKGSFHKGASTKELHWFTEDWSTQLLLSVLYIRGSTKLVRFTSSWWS